MNTLLTEGAKYGARFGIHKCQVRCIRKQKLSKMTMYAVITTETLVMDGTGWIRQWS